MDDGRNRAFLEQDLSDAADELARVKAVLAGDEATIEKVARAMFETVDLVSGERQQWDGDSDQIERHIYTRDATAALAALRELIGGV